jgi:phosphotriesterase-related protein
VTRRSAAGRIVVEMCRRGFAGSMVLSQDESCYIDWLEPGVMAMLPQRHDNHIHTEEQIHTMPVANPRRSFENDGAR